MENKEEKDMMGQQIATPTAEMAGTKEPSKNYRQLLKGRNAELDENDDDAVYNYLDKSFKEYDTMSEENAKAKQAAKDMSDLINRDKDARNIFDGLLSQVDENGNPFTLTGYILNAYWDEIKDSQSSEEAMAKIAKQQEADVAEEEAKATRSKTRQQNYDKAEKALEEAKAECGADNKTAGEMLDWLLNDEDEAKGLIWRAPMFELTKDDFVKLLHAFMRDGDLEKAAKKGREEGLSQQPGRAHRRKETPTDLGAGSGLEPEMQEEDPTARRYSTMKPRFS